LHILYELVIFSASSVLKLTDPHGLSSHYFLQNLHAAMQV
jgi:hypothetical protein